MYSDENQKRYSQVNSTDGAQLGEQPLEFVRKEVYLYSHIAIYC